MNIELQKYIKEKCNIIDTCWIPKLKSCPAGYKRIKFNNKIYQVHRLSYETFIGEIPKGMHVHHKCENKSCCNPGHLQLKTPKDHAVLHKKSKKIGFIFNLSSLNNTTEELKSQIINLYTKYPKIIKRILNSVEITANCWVCKTKIAGYCSLKIEVFPGIFVYGRHRAMALLFNNSINTELQVHHICCNIQCCNPQHLKLITIKEHSKEKHVLNCKNCNNILTRRKSGTSAGCSYCNNQKRRLIGPKIDYNYQCGNGHIRTKENTRIDPKTGYKRCKLCDKKNSEKYRKNVCK